MTKKKLLHFTENLTFKHLFQYPHQGLLRQSLSRQESRLKAALSISRTSLSETRTGMLCPSHWTTKSPLMTQCSAQYTGGGYWLSYLQRLSSSSLPRSLAYCSEGARWQEPSKLPGGKTTAHDMRALTRNRSRLMYAPLVPCCRSRTVEGTHPFPDRYHPLIHWRVFAQLA